MKRLLWVVAALGLSAWPARADVIVDYTVDAGGSNTSPLNGLSARGTFALAGNQLQITLENTSTGIPSGFDAAAQLLVSLAFNLPGVDFFSGDAAVIAPGSVGLGQWSNRGPNDSVAEEWLWTNAYGGDLLSAYRNVISTSDGQGGGLTTRFDNLPGNVGGPFGGIAPAPPLLSVPNAQRAVSNAIVFRLTLTGPLTAAELEAVANGSIVEFGSDVRYLRVPEPAGLAFLALGGLATLRRARC